MRVTRGGWEVLFMLQFVCHLCLLCRFSFVHYIGLHNGWMSKRRTEGIRDREYGAFVVGLWVRHRGITAVLSECYRRLHFVSEIRCHLWFCDSFTTISIQLNVILVLTGIATDKDIKKT